ncbi:FAD-dependent pyridine nucleotide-disulfide oxidoreductase [Streptomyces albus]|uniref:FAD-dependent pyridine nucleotide-disulfide oxidoreductase n=1 Tax=Streptomyces albus (strain ATCC 21838 / DSM 41398 / FERM P-419 / JCM 4703 / NBRC 107858) TaxID=1081613 RepID=A0A0B5ENL1_STRA4|nr:FAD-dependent pyridine nucleotide-disulfide oxidoreductase [Streptomyces albus]AOU74716.1 FAD-dependent pyridine nucleotide-disulfide oxidoreductase [Streptomyces albus]AYN30527.1 FAD-dependent pyridine nucleotide-disulfide oxidoreductase [Streptomyces albus]
MGGGHGGFETARSLRENGFEGALTLVSEESFAPYERPPLSKAYLVGQVCATDLAFREKSFYRDNDIELLVGDKVVGLDRADRTVCLSEGGVRGYDDLVLAVGASPVLPDIPGSGLEGVEVLRTLADAQRLRARLAPGQRLVVVGGGFIGLELASCAPGLGVDVTVVEVADRLMAGKISVPTAQHFLDFHRGNGVVCRLGTGARAIEGAGGRVCAVHTTGGSRLPADLVVLAVGVRPRTELARAAGLAVDDGILVDTDLRTQDPAISAIGDCARFPSPHAGAPVRIESVQNAADQARHVAARITGAATAQAFSPVPWFWSQQGTMKLQIAGLTTGHDHVVTVPGGRHPSALCFREERLVGIETINAPRHHLSGRRLLASERRPTAAEAAAPDFDLDLIAAPRRG